MSEKSALHGKGNNLSVGIKRCYKVIKGERFSEFIHIVDLWLVVFDLAERKRPEPFYEFLGVS